MRVINRWLVAGATASVALLAACNASDTLNVENTDQPDVARALSTADGIDAVLRGGFGQIFASSHASTTGITEAAMVIALESYGSVANFGMNLRATIPRLPIDNGRGNATAAENFRDFQNYSARGRTVANAIAALDKFVASGGSLGTPALDARGRSFGFFALGWANGNLSLMYDSVATPTPALGSSDVPPLVGYQDGMKVALAQLDSAILIATKAKADGNTFDIPATYIPIGSGIDLDTYVAILHSLKARLRAGVARDPAERAAVDWGAVVADAQAGIKGNIVLDLDASAGIGYSWLNQAAVFQGWHNMPPYVIGMADTSSGYQNWLATERGQRQPFLILTPDLRFPQGATRAAQLANSPPVTAVLPSVYFRNRSPNEDTPGENWANSFYDFVRYRHYRQLASTGPWNWITQTENEMLLAEGLIRLNRPAEAVPYINRTRVINGLAPFPAGSSAATRAPAQPGGSATSCVPRTPTGPGNSLECGTLLEAMKWEKRMETIFSGYVLWIQDSRGWGDLPVGSPVMWPVPFQEMDARVESFYNSITGDSKWQAQSSTYGFGVGSK
jgi:hypothetical protein